MSVQLYLELVDTKKVGRIGAYYADNGIVDLTGLKDQKMRFRSTRHFYLYLINVFAGSQGLQVRRVYRRSGLFRMKLEYSLPLIISCNNLLVSYPFAFWRTALVNSQVRVAFTLWYCYLQFWAFWASLPFLGLKKHLCFLFLSRQSGKLFANLVASHLQRVALYISSRADIA